MIQWDADTICQSVSNIQLLLFFLTCWGNHFVDVLDDLFENILDKEVGHFEGTCLRLPWLISLIQCRLVELNIIMHA